MEEIIVEILLDDRLLVADADDEIVDTVIGVNIHDMHEDRRAAQLDHRLGLGDGLFGKPCAISARENDCLHMLPIKSMWPVF